MARLIRVHNQLSSISLSNPCIDFELIARTIRLYGKSQAINQGKSLHCHVMKLGIYSNTYISNNLIAMYANFGHLSHAHNLFDEMPYKNVASWTSLISAYTHSGYAKEALRVFKNMLTGISIEPNVYTLSIALKACAWSYDLEFGRFIHDFISRREINCDTILGNAILDMFVKCGALHEARNFFSVFNLANTNSYNTLISGYLKEGYINEAENIFNCISQPDSVSFNTMITGFAQINNQKALNYTYLMHKNGFKLDNFTFPCLLKTCGAFDSERIGTQIHTYILKIGFESNNHTGSALIDMYSNCGCINDAIRVYELYFNCGEIIAEELPLVNSMLSGFVINGYDKLAINMVNKIHNLGILPDIFTLSSCLKACINLENIKIGFQAHGFIVKSGYEFDNVIRTCLMDLYAMCGRLNDAFELFEGLKCKDSIAWTELISSCVKHGSYQLAFSLFKEIIISFEIEIDEYIVSSILKACSSLAWIQGGTQIHSYTIKLGFHLESIVVACLIDMYSKCGNVENALRIFELVGQRDIILWTSIITGCAYNSKPQKTLDIFNEMVELGIKPNEITILSVLYACRNAGLVNEACNNFANMKNKFGLRPSLEHYSCMIDILSRVGKFDEAKRLILEMPYEVNGNIKNCLIGGSFMNQNICGEYLSFDLIKSSNDDVSSYIVISNAYASLGMWDISAKIRDVIRKDGMKNAGISWV